LSRPSSLLRPPPTPFTARHFPCVGYRRACFPGRRPGVKEGLSSSHDTPPTVPLPMRRGVLGHPLQVPWCRPWLRQPNTGSAPPWPRSRGGFSDDAAGFASCCGPVGCSTPLRTRLLGHARGLRYRGPWRLPGPDSHRLAAVSLSLGYAADLLSLWRPNCWTHEGHTNSRSGPQAASPYSWMSPPKMVLARMRLLGRPGSRIRPKEGLPRRLPRPCWEGQIPGSIRRTPPTAPPPVLGGADPGLNKKDSPDGSPTIVHPSWRSSGTELNRRTGSGARCPVRRQLDHRIDSAPDGGTRWQTASKVTSRTGHASQP
jgi:hypothetical protein